MPYPLPPSPPPLIQTLSPEKFVHPVSPTTTPPETAVGGLLSESAPPVATAATAEQGVLSEPTPPALTSGATESAATGDRQTSATQLVPPVARRADLLGPPLSRQLNPSPDLLNTELSLTGTPAIAPLSYSFTPLEPPQPEPRSQAQLPVGPPFSPRQLPQQIRPQSVPTPATPPPEAAPSVTPTPPASGDQAAGEPIEVQGDLVEFDEIRRVFTGVGDVLLRFREAELQADRLQTDLPDRRVVAEGNVSLTRGQQMLRGDRLEYNLVEERGTFFNVSGVIYLPSSGRDFSGDDLPTPVVNNSLQSLIERLEGQVPNQIGPEQPRIDKTGEIQRLRFQADRIEFTPQGWQAKNIRITSDPFSPPELELRAEAARLEQISPLEDRVTATRPRLVFDQRIFVPIPRSQVTLSRRRRDPFGLSLGIDSSDRGGLYLGRRFTPFAGDRFRLTLTPQFFLERAITTQNFNLADPDLYGGTLKFASRATPNTFISGFVSLTSLESRLIEDNTRANFRAIQNISGYALALEASYRDRLYNGTLGEQNVENSFGLVLASPTYTLGDTGLRLSFQVSSQYITADTDETDLSSPDSLGRFQGTFGLGRSFNLWRGTTLPPTATAGLRYTPEPIQPFVQLFTSVRGVSSFYTSDDDQQTLVGTVGFRGQIGHFSRPWLDYTGFSVSYSQVGQLGESPFLFDRVVDFKVFSATILQQIYGPVRLGFRTSINVDTGELFNTDVILDYSRRTYGVTLRYSPYQQFGSIVFRVNGFNWVGDTGPFDQPDVGIVEDGVIRLRE